MDPKEILLRLVAEILLSDSKLRFSSIVTEALDVLDEEELQEVTDEIARERDSDDF